MLNPWTFHGWLKFGNNINHYRSTIASSLALLQNLDVHMNSVQLWLMVHLFIWCLATFFDNFCSYFIFVTWSFKKWTFFAHLCVVCCRLNTSRHGFRPNEHRVILVTRYAQSIINLIMLDVLIHYSLDQNFVSLLPDYQTNPKKTFIRI